jgi:hypothetical protein
MRPTTPTHLKPQLEPAEETGYSDFSAMEISSVLTSDDLTRLVGYVRDGEFEFKFVECSVISR